MAKYPMEFAYSVSDEYIKAHPRAWGWVSQNFYIRDEDLADVFSKDQFLWNKIKNLVRFLEKHDNGYLNIEIPDSVLKRLVIQVPEIRAFWSAYSRRSEKNHTDAMDYLTFVKRKPALPPSLHQPSLFS
jgi:hypothetical protein